MQALSKKRNKKRKYGAKTPTFELSLRRCAEIEK